MNGLKFLSNVDEGQLKNFPMTKGQKIVPKTKKEKRADKRVLMKNKIEARHGIRDEDSSIEAQQTTTGRSDKSETGNVENMKRQTFTKGWMESFTEKEALPTKQQGKVIRTINYVKEEESEDENSGMNS